MQIKNDLLDVLFVAGFGPVTRCIETSKRFYIDELGLPLKPIEGNAQYLLTEQKDLDGVKHFAL